MNVTAETTKRIYDECWATAPTAHNHHEQAGITRARTVAAHYGWVPPLAWDDDTIDDPGAHPDLGQPTGRDTRARVEDAIELFDAGEIPERIAARLGITLSTLTQNVRRHAPEWANAFKAAERRERGRSVSA